MFPIVLRPWHDEDQVLILSLKHVVDLVSSKSRREDELKTRYTSRTVLKELVYLTQTHKDVSYSSYCLHFRHVTVANVLTFILLKFPLPTELQFPLKQCPPAINRKHNGFKPELTQKHW